jgi:hypothetical protein
MIRTNVGTYSRQVGDVTVTALLDGQFEGTASMIPWLPNAGRI